MAEKKQKKGHPVRNTTVGVGLLAVLALLFGPKFGLGAGGGVIPAMGQQAPQVQQVLSSEKPEEKVEEAINTNLIRIENEIIYYMNEPVSIEELREKLLENVKEGVVKIEGDQAIKGAYDSVTSLLKELGIEHAS